MILRILIEIVYESIIANKLSGKYLPRMALTSFNGILYLTKVRSLRNISTIAMKKTKDENLLKNITTRIIKTIKIIKSIYIQSPILLNFIININILQLSIIYYL